MLEDIPGYPSRPDYPFWELRGVRYFFWVSFAEDMFGHFGGAAEQLREVADENLFDFLECFFCRIGKLL